MARRHSFNGGQNRNENVQGITRSASLLSGSPEESDNTGLPASPATTPGLGTVRVGTLRPPEITSTSTRRQVISDLLVAEEVGIGVGGDSGKDLRVIISNRKSSGKRFDKAIGEGGAFSSYTPEEKVNVCCFYFILVLPVRDR